MGDVHQVQYAAAPSPSEAPSDDKSQQTAPATGDRPEWLPENFTKPEDLAKSYTEAQSEMGRLRAKLSEFEKGTKSEPDKGTDGAKEELEKPLDLTTAGEQTKSVLEQAGVDFDLLATEWGEKGSLSEDSYETLTKAGFPKELVDQHIQGLQALADQQESEVFSAVGGKDNFETMKNWASTNLTPDQKQAFNEAVNSDSIPRVKQAMLALRAAYDQANGSTPTLVKGQASRTGGVAGFRSRAEMTEAMGDPRYSTDPAYRNDVIARMAATTEML